MNSEELRNLQEAYLEVYESSGFLSSLDKVARDTAGRIGGEIGAKKGREKFGNVLGIPERIGRDMGTQQGQQAYDRVKSSVRKVLSQSYDPYLENADEVDEALKPSVVRATARQQYTSQAVKQRVSGNTANKPSPGSIRPQPQTGGTQRIAGGGMGGARGSAPQRVSMTRLYHGTTKPASQSISQKGWRTDTNITRQMQGSGVYTTPQKSAAQMYANQRSAQRGESPAVRSFRIPTKTFDKVKAQRQQQGTWTANKGGQKFNIVQMSPKGANRYDITDKPQSAGAIRFSGPQKQELRQRTSTALSKPQNRSALKRDISKSRISRPGGSSSLSGAGARPSGSTGRYQVGGSQGYGLSGIKLADHYDAYNIILTHLIDEGYATSISAAKNIFVNMSEEWRTIVVQQLFLEESTSAQQQFYKDLRSRFKKAGASDVEADLGAAQGALETGWGRSPSGKNNYFGQKASRREAGTTKKTWEVQGGRNITTNAKFKDYDDLDSSVRDRLNKWSYKTRGSKSVEDAARRLQIPGGGEIPGSKERSHGAYATDPDYVSKVSSIAKRYGSGAIGAAGVSAASRSIPKPTTKGALDTPAPTRVLAKLKGKTGELDKTTNKFTQRGWSQPEGSRYKAFGGK